MSTERFDLRAGSNTIYLFYRNGRDINFRWSTKIKVINKKNWSKRNQKIRENKTEIGAYGKNTELRKIRSYFNECFPNNKSEKELKKILDDKFRNIKNESLLSKPKKLGLFEYFQQVIDNDVSKATKSSYQNSFNHLKRYNENLSFEDINLNFYDDFILFMKSAKTTYTGRPLPSGYQHNTIAASLKVLKTIMNRAYNRNLHSNRSHSLEDFKVEFLDNNQISLTKKQIDDVINLKLTDKKLIDCRKYFIIGCYSSLRISDLLSIDENSFYDGMINFTPKKGDSPTNRNDSMGVPINSKINKIIQDGFPTTHFTNPSFNTAIRQLCKLAKIENYASVSSHTLRRSFGTNAYNSGVDIGDISILMRHDSIKTTLKYLKISNKEKAKIIQKKYDFLK